MIWVLLIGVIFAFNISSLENTSVPFFSDEYINIFMEDVGNYGILVKNHKIIDITEPFDNPTVEIYLSKNAISYYTSLFSSDIPNVEKRERAIKYLKNNMDKEIKIVFLGWSGVFKMLLFKLYLMVV